MPLQAPPAPFYSDPRQANAAVDAAAADEVIPAIETAAPFAFPHLHLRKVVRASQVNAATCKELEASIGAMQCSLVTYISGYPEGCECQLTKPCPPFPEELGFTGLSPSDTVSFPQTGDIKVSLCMYWQMRAPSQKPANNAESVQRAQNLVKQAIDQATANSAAVGNLLWALTPTPFPRAM